MHSLLQNNTCSVCIKTFVFLLDGPAPELPDKRSQNSAEILEPNFVEKYFTQSLDKHDALLTAQRLEESTHMEKCFWSTDMQQEQMLARPSNDEDREVLNSLK